MKIAVLKECRPGEARVATSPEVAGKLIALGFDVSVETGAGDGASFLDGILLTLTKSKLLTIIAKNIKGEKHVT